MMNKVLILIGPTASGKTKLSLIISKSLECEIINADSRQIYKYMNIGTAKPNITEQQSVRHHFVDIIQPDEHYDAGLFGQQGREVIEKIHNLGKTPLVVGGSGLYIRSLVDGLFIGPSRNKKIRGELENRIKEKGTDDLLSELVKIDPETAKRLNPTRHPHIIRALEVYYLTGRPLSELQQKNKIQINFIPIFYGINWDRKVLYERVNKRTEEMIHNGLLEECKYILSSGYSKNLKSLQTVGYQECFSYFDGILSYQETIDLIKQNTRHYVKRQMTWFNHEKRIKWIDLKDESEFENIARWIVEDFQQASSI
jgi:tRNA dimethylallyltransferase